VLWWRGSWSVPQSPLPDRSGNEDGSTAQQARAFLPISRLKEEQKVQREAERADLLRSGRALLEEGQQKARAGDYDGALLAHDNAARAFEQLRAEQPSELSSLRAKISEGKETKLALERWLIDADHKLALGDYKGAREARALAGTEFDKCTACGEFKGRFLELGELIHTAERAALERSASAGEARQNESLAEASEGPRTSDSSDRAPLLFICTIAGGMLIGFGLLKTNLQAPPDRSPGGVSGVEETKLLNVNTGSHEIQKTCSICLMECAASVESSGVECSEGHWHCVACVSNHAQSFMEASNLGQLREREGHLKCSKYPLECHAGITDQDLAQRLPVDLFRKYLEARVEIIGAQRRAQLEAEMRDRLTAELQRLAALDERARKVQAARAHIVEKILTLACPRQGCGQAFVDFDGCCALVCSRCACGFCAWCLADCGNDAHEHVRQCDQKPPGADVYFGSQAQFAAAQKRRQEGLVRRYLAEEVDAGLKVEVAAACRAELEAHELWPVN
jgi:hypothetical protein